jgi:hypothetical protein
MSLRHGLATALVLVIAFGVWLRRDLVAPSPGQESTRALTEQAGAERLRPLQARLAPPSFVSRDAGAWRITGEVVTESGAPVSGAVVGASDDTSRMATTDEQGRFALDGLRTDAVKVYAVARGHAPTTPQLVSAGSGSLRLVVQRPVQVRGSVAAPVPASYRIDLCSRERRDEGTGEPLCVARRLFDPATAEFTLDRLPAGSWELVVVAPDEGREARAHVTAAPGEAVTLAPLVLTSR